MQIKLLISFRYCSKESHDKKKVNRRYVKYTRRHRRAKRKRRERRWNEGGWWVHYINPATRAISTAPNTELPTTILFVAAPWNSKGLLGVGTVLFAGTKGAREVVELMGIAGGAGGADVKLGGLTYTVVVTLGVQVVSVEGLT